jgi:hypothetical protein
MFSFVKSLTKIAPSEIENLMQLSVPILTERATEL